MGCLIKGLFYTCLLSLTTATFADCNLAEPPTSSGFCESFRQATECHCMLSGLPKGQCTNMKLVYRRMIDTLGPLQRVCAYQHHTSTQACIDDWNCYRYGGLTSDNQLCNGSGNACE